MSVYKPTMRHLQEVVLYYFNSRESASDAHRMLIEAYGQGIISRSRCYVWYERFVKGDFNISRSTNKQLKKQQVIEELVRLRLENPDITQAEMAAKVGTSRMTVSRYEKCQEYQKKLEEKKHDQGSIPVEFTTPRRRYNREQTIEELVRLRLEDPSITLAEMAAKVGVSVSTIWKYQNSQEYQNKLKEKKQEQSSIPLDLTVKRRRIDSDRY